MLGKRKFGEKMCDGLEKKSRFGQGPACETSRLKVFVRIRPFSLRETSLSQRNVLSVLDNRSLIFDPKEEEEAFYFHGVVENRRDVNKKVKKNLIFDFDQVFGHDSTNCELFEETTKKIIPSIFQGYNCSVFAYGATGAGKTYTMLGSHDAPGIAYLTIVELLNHVENQQDHFKITLGASYIEVYNENVRDLLNPGAQNLHLREECGVVIIAGLRVTPIVDTEQLFALLENGNRQRSQHPTDNNAESSRSHAVFQVHVKMQNKLNGEVKISKLSMIDLAGSERGTATGYSGARFKEGSNINKSLLALGNCINALADGLKHIPFRDSKLTRILKDSLGGNCQTLMVANISPSSGCFDDTYNTLKYATRAKTISTKLSQNVVATMSIPQYRKRIRELEEALANSKGGKPDSEWTKQLGKVMEQRKKLHSEALMLQSQKKLTEWRLFEKLQELKAVSTQLEDFTRLTSCIDQLRGRLESIRGRIDELSPELTANSEERDKLVQFLNNVKSNRSIYEDSLESWENKIEMAQKDVIQKYLTQLLKLKDKRLEAHRAYVRNTAPFTNKCFNLLKMYNHTTNALTQEYEASIRSLSDNKEVTWNSSEEDEEFSETNTRLPYFLTLSIPGSAPEVKELEEKQENDLRAELSCIDWKTKKENYKLKDLTTKPIRTPLKDVENGIHPNKGKKLLFKFNENLPRKKNHKNPIKISSIPGSGFKNMTVMKNGVSLTELRSPASSLNDTFTVDENVGNLKAGHMKSSIRVHPYKKAAVTPYRRK